MWYNAYLPPELSDETSAQYQTRPGMDVPPEFYQMGAMPQIYGAPSYDDFARWDAPMRNTALSLSEVLDRFAQSNSPEEKQALAQQAAEYRMMLKSMGEQRAAAYSNALKETPIYQQAQYDYDVIAADPAWKDKILAPGYVGNGFPHNDLQGIGLSYAMQNPIANKYGMNTYDFDYDLNDYMNMNAVPTMPSDPNALLDLYRNTVGY